LQHELEESKANNIIFFIADGVVETSSARNWIKIDDCANQMEWGRGLGRVVAQYEMRLTSVFNDRNRALEGVA
jgi:hypothetical protein